MANICGTLDQGSHRIDDVDERNALLPAASIFADNQMVPTGVAQ
jgi:hypothetical protein